MINFSKQLGVVTTAIALTSATVGVLPAAAFQIIKHEFSGTLELLSSPIIDEPIIDEPIPIIDEPIPIIDEPPPQTIDYDGFVEYNTEGELLSWFLDVEGLSGLGFESGELWPYCSTITSPTITSPTITSPTITFSPINPSPSPFLSIITLCMFKATPDSWIIDIDFGRVIGLGGQTLTWERESGITFNIGGTRGTDITYVDPNPNFKETITNLPSNWVNVDPNPNFSVTITNLTSKPDITSVPEPVSGLALLGISALGAGSFLKRKDN
ncbi:hypothetical protein [Moorena bouillonii]|uniref:PEP-CTERM protein-sorting domain-containing protein n=1 Tax=Moorena bouillonii PNG TaxID=568701 RepID=A0A1U7N651_9CYAN|nr:hypothetical protein [Moorena bouillonii]OLT61427.1 hypothetical protein BJP37_22860 [Moorena bouillonii PNG]